MLVKGEDLLMLWQGGGIMSQIRGIRKLLAILAFGLVFCGYAAGAEIWQVAVVGFTAYLIWPGKDKDDKAKVENGKDSKMEFSSLYKAKADYIAIQAAIGQISDSVMVAQLQKLQIISNRILKYLDSHPNRLPVAAKYINYYQDRTASLVRQYLTLRETEMQTESMTKLQQDMITTFQGFEVAYEQQFSRIIDAQMMDMDAEMEVARQIMQGEGIDCKEIEMQAQQIAEETVKGVQKKESGNWNLKKTGIVIGAFVLGAFGAYKVMEKNDKEKSK